MLSIRLLLTPFAVIVLLYSCSKEHLPQASGERLYRIVNSDGDSTLYLNFNYDAEGKLTLIEDSNSQTHLGRIFLYYNEDNKMVKRVWMRYYGSLNNLLGQGIDSFIYDNNDRITKTILISTPNNTPTYKTINSFSYDEQGRLIADTTHSYWNNDITALTKFTYDAGGDVVQSENVSYTSGAVQNSTITKFTYNTTENPYKDLGMAAYLFLYDKEMMLSKHVPLQASFQDNSTNSYSYEYYSNGLPKKVINVYSNQNWSSQHTTEFFYQ